MDFEFRFPYPSGGLYDPYTETAFIWGKDYGFKGSVSALSHETIHYVIVKITNDTKLSEKFDKIAKKVRRWDKKIYIILY